MDVTKGQGRCLLGRNWMKDLNMQLNFVEIGFVAKSKLDDLLGDYATLFKDELGCFLGPKAHLSVDKSVTPIFCKARPVPFALKKDIEKQLEKSVNEGVLVPVQYSHWAAPIVPIHKPDKSIRLCADYKVTVNKAIHRDKYPIPTIADLYAGLCRGKQFSKLDLSQAYHQIQVDDESCAALTMNTHRGLFRPTRLPFGVSSAPGIFQRVMDGLLAGLPGVTVYLDDIIVNGETLDTHLDNLRRVFDVLLKNGLRLKRNKCVFLADSVTYLGHQIDATGLHPVKDKVEAVEKVPQPKDKSELRAFLGMLNHYRHFLPNLSHEMQPLFELLKKNVVWRWTEKQQSAFDRAKKMLTSADVLVHFNPTIPVILECDASSQGIGAVLLHRFHDGERPIAFASRSLNPAEKRYSQIEREALAIIFGVKRFHKYIYGLDFILRSDHKPLLQLFGEHKGVPLMTSARIQRWAIALSAYTYRFEFRKGTQIPSADALSRLPLPTSPATVPLPAEMVHLMEVLDECITYKEIAKETAKDSLLTSVMRMVQGCWPSSCPSPELMPFFRKRLELSSVHGVLLCGNRAVIPPKYRSNLLQQLHDCHPGVSRMKSYARSYFWWPGMDKEIEELGLSCPECCENRDAPPQAPLQSWTWPTRPWTRLHIDHAGPVNGRTYLVLVDAHSKWVEIDIVPSTSSRATIRVLRKIFSVHGLPLQIVSDNAAGFTSDEFAAFLEKNGISHLRAPPFHPSTNGLAERFVRTFKTALKRKSPDLDCEVFLSRFLFKYRNTPHQTTKLSPAELLLGRKPRGRFDRLRPEPAVDVERELSLQKKNHDVRVKERHFQVGQPVLSRAGQSPWQRGVVTQQRSTRDYDIASGDKVVHRHQDQLLPVSSHVPSHVQMPVPSHVPSNVQKSVPPGDVPNHQDPSPTGSIPVAAPLRRSERIRKMQELQ